MAFSFGTIVNGGGTEVIGPEDTVVVEVTALVRDIQSNEPGAVLTDTASIGFVIGGRAGTDTATASVDVVGPELVVTKAVNHPTGDAGDSFIYTVTISHAATFDRSRLRSRVGGSTAAGAATPLRFIEHWHGNPRRAKRPARRAGIAAGRRADRVDLCRADDRCDRTGSTSSEPRHADFRQRA